MSESQDIREAVRRRYAAAATRSGCGDQEGLPHNVTHLHCTIPQEVFSDEHDSGL